MPSTELVEYEVGDESYLIPSWLKGLTYVSEEALQEVTINAILTAGSLDDAMAPPGEAGKLADLAGEVITVLSAGWRPSEIPGASLPIYVIFDVERDDGAREVVTCGAPRVIAVLDRAAAEKAFPLKCRVVAVESNKKGRSAMLSLVRVRTGEEDF